MTPCAHHYEDDATGMTCTRVDAHAPGHGCTYVSSTGSDLSDRRVEE